MSEQLRILPVLPDTFEYQEYSQEDNQLISASILDTVFSSSSDYIEYYAYDENKNLIYPQPPVKAVSIQSYRVLEGDTLLYPAEDLENYGFVQGKYFSTYNFYRTKLGSNITINYYISEISSDRTELRLKSNAIPNDIVVSSSMEFITQRKEADYFVDFLLNFGNDQQVIANNISLDTESEENASILIKLYEPLPSTFQVKSTLWVVEEISAPQAYNVQFPQINFDQDDFTYISGPNYSLNVKNETGESGEIFSYNTLINSNVTSSTSQIRNLLDRKEINININYEVYNEFVNFSTAKTRLENFVYKAGLIQSSSAVLSASFGAVEGATTGSTVYSSSKAVEEAKINEIINNFDGYEYFLYFNSGSKHTYPKITTTPPYVLASTSSVLATDWETQQAISASEYDDNNQNSLYYAIPEYLRTDPNNARYELFVDMVGQHYDNVWTYTKDLTNRFNGDNRLDYGISKDLVADAIKDFGVKLYANSFNTDDLYTAFLGLTPSGSTFPLPNITSSYPAASGFEYVDTKISASNDIIPLDNANKRLYKRIYHNIPYLLKTKGTITGLRALITSYGIPDTILRINEFGGKDRVTTEDWDLKQSQFNKAYTLDGSTHFSSSFLQSSQFFSQVDAGIDPYPDVIQFRFKTIAPPTSSFNQVVWMGGTGGSIITLEYTGSGNTSGSYSGAVPANNKQFGTLNFYPFLEQSKPDSKLSIQAPFFDEGWWSVQAGWDNPDGTGRVGVFEKSASLFVGNSKDGKLQYNRTSSGMFSPSYWSDNLSSFPSKDGAGVYIFSQDYQPLSGSIQEIRYWARAVNHSGFLDYVVNPYSVQGSRINSTPDDLSFRASLGSNLDTGSRTSIHPKATGSWEEFFPSFLTAPVNGFYLSDGTKFENNKEDILLNQTPGGIKNRVSDKIQIANNVIPSGSTLSPFRKVEQSPYISGSEPNVNYLEVAFSPTDQVNDDIIGQIGAFNLGDYIGDPLQVMQNRMAGEYISGSSYPWTQPASSIPEKDLNPYNYPTLDSLRDAYFLKYINSYDINDFVRLIKFFDNSLFKMIEDFTPARTTLSSGVVIKQNLLERNRYAPPSASYTDETLSGSIKPFPRDYNTGSTDYPQNNLVSGSSIYTYQGGTGGVFEPFNNLFAAPVYYSGSTTPYSSLTTQQVATSSFYKAYSQVTQSFTESVSSSTGLVTVLRDDQREFYNGEFQGGGGAINFTMEEPCRAYFGNDNLEDYFYRIEWFFGNNETTNVIPYHFNLSINMGLQLSGDLALDQGTQSMSTTMSISEIDATGGSQFNTFNNLSQLGELGNLKLVSTNNNDYLLFPIENIKYFNPNTSASFQNMYRTGQLLPPPTRMELLFNNTAVTSSLNAFVSFTGSNFSAGFPDQSAALKTLVTSSSAGIDMGNVIFTNTQGTGTTSQVVGWKVNSVTMINPSDAYVTINFGALITGSGTPFPDLTRVDWSIVPTSSGAWFEFNLGTVASQSSAIPFVDNQDINVQLISTASFAPVAPQFQKEESWFLDTENCPGDGYAWFWTAFNEAGQKAKYIKISNKTANNFMINQFIPYSNYITFNLNEARTGGSAGYVVNGFQTWQIANATVMDDGIPSTSDCSLIFVDPNDTSLAVNSNDPLFTNFSFSSSGQFIWYATGSGIDPNVEPALHITQSSPQGYFPPVGNYSASNEGMLVWFVREIDGLDYVDTNLRINSAFPGGGFGGSGSQAFTGDQTYVLDNISFGVSSSDYRYAMHVKNLSSGELMYTSSQGSVSGGNTTPAGFISASVPTPMASSIVDTYTLSAKAGNVYGITLVAQPDPAFKLPDQLKSYTISRNGNKQKTVQSTDFYGKSNTAFVLTASLLTTVEGSGSQDSYLIVGSDGITGNDFGNINTGYVTQTDFNRYNIPKRFPTTQFQKGWGGATFYGNTNGDPVYMGTGSGFLFDPNNNFNTGSKEFDADSTSLLNGQYEASTYPWFMNAVPTQSMVTSSLFNIYTISGNFTSSAFRTKFEKESVNFGPIYTVYTASAAIENTPLIQNNLPPLPTTTFTCPSTLTNLGNAGGNFVSLIQPPTSGTNYSSSLSFFSPSITNNQSVVPWAFVTSGGTGTGFSTLTISYNGGYTGLGTSTTYTRNCNIRIFEEINGVMVEVSTVCSFSQAYLFQTGPAGGGGSGGGGGGIPGYIPNQ